MSSSRNFITGETSIYDDDGAADVWEGGDTGVLDLTEAERAELELEVTKGHYIGGAAGLAYGFYKRSFGIAVVLGVLGYFAGGLAAGAWSGATIAGDRR